MFKVRHFKSILVTTSIEILSTLTATIIVEQDIIIL